MEKILKQFLRGNNALENYYRNVHKREGTIAIYNELIRCDSQWNIINGIFSWEESSEGFPYWARINDKWLPYLSDNKFNADYKSLIKYM